MRKWVWIMLAALLCMIPAGSRLNVKAAETKAAALRIEQVHATMPEMEVYYYLENVKLAQDPSQIEAVYAGEKMNAVSLAPFSPDNGIDYYFLLDISASISKEYFAGIQEAIIRFQSKMNAADRMTLITFGDQVTTVFENAAASDDCSAQIRALENKDMTTALFEAINTTAKLVDTDAKAMKRSVAFVISDGEDFATNKSSSNEALDTLQRTGLPVYSLVADKTNRGKENESINAFGEFTRSTGGVLAVFDRDTAWKRLKELRDGLFNAMVLKLSADSNQVYQTLQPLTVTLSGQVSATTQVLAKRAAADNQPPTAQVEEVSSKVLRVVFSERVKNADVPGNYKITKDGEEPLVNYTVSYSESNGYEALLTFENEFYNGDYEISYINICDDSNEANLVQGTSTLTIEDGLKEDSTLMKLWKKYWLVLVAVLTVLIVLIIILVFYRRVKKNKGVVVVDGKVTLGNNVDVKQKVNIQKQSGHEIIFVMNDRKQGQKELPVVVDESLFVGRSEMCDLSFNDATLSAQHFVIEEAQDGFYIQDLNSDNGTMINGVRIHQRRKLNQGDTICAGMIEMKVRW